MGDYQDFVQAVLKQVAATFGVPAKIVTDCNCSSYASCTVTISGVPTYATDAGYAIARLPPYVFSQSKADLLGNRCVVKLWRKHKC